MDVLCSSEKIIQDCTRSSEKIIFTTIQNTKKVENALQQKIQILEYYTEELILEKNKLIGDTEAMSLIMSRTEQTMKSLQYPKDTNLKCTEIR